MKETMENLGGRLRKIATISPPLSTIGAPMAGVRSAKHAHFAKSAPIMLTSPMEAPSAVVTVRKHHFGTFDAIWRGYPLHQFPVAINRTDFSRKDSSYLFQTSSPLQQRSNIKSAAFGVELGLTIISHPPSTPSFTPVGS